MTCGSVTCGSVTCAGTITQLMAEASNMCMLTFVACPSVQQGESSALGLMKHAFVAHALLMQYSGMYASRLIMLTQHC